LSLLGKLN